MPARRKPGSALNAKEKLVALALRKAGRPMSAYDLIGELKEQGFTSPPTVYRALTRLVTEGLAHRIESLNAFVCCAHDHHKGAAVFAICDDCGDVDEFGEEEVARRLRNWARGSSFQIRHMSIEIRGRCAECSLEAQP
jgi:Fur family zinc uptake transcriptional regulator